MYDTGIVRNAVRMPGISYFMFTTARLGSELCFFSLCHEKQQWTGFLSVSILLGLVG